MKLNVIDRLAMACPDPLVFGRDEQTKAKHEGKPGRSGFTARRVENIDSLIADILMHDAQDTPSLMKWSYNDHGTEALAWYQSYYHWDEDWGIFLDVNSIARFIQDYDVGSESALIVSILHHERFHFLVEYACAAVSYPISENHGTNRNQTYERYREEKKLVTNYSKSKRPWLMPML